VLVLAGVRDSLVGAPTDEVTVRSADALDSPLAETVIVCGFIY